MPRCRITKTELKNMKPSTTGSKIYWDTALPAFGVKFHPSGRATYVVQFRLRGSRASRQVTLGSTASLSPDQARERARKHLDASRDGVDLDRAVRARVKAAEDDRKRIAAMLIVAEAVPKFLAWMEATKSRRSQRVPTASTVRANGTWLRMFTNMHGNRALGEITSPDVQAVLSATPAPSQRNIYGAIHRLFSWAVASGHAHADPTTSIDPPPRPLPRENTPSPDDVRIILDAADRLAAEGTWEHVQRDAVWLIALTAQRRAEVAAMDWSEIDLLKAVWVQPAHKNKTKRAHSVPLGKTAVTLLERRWGAAGQPAAGLVLPGVRSGGLMTANLSDLQARLRKETGVKFVFHDLRRSAVSTMAEKGVDFAVADSLLNHAASESRGGMLKVYQRAALTAFKRNAVEVWEAALLQCDAGEVLKFYQRSA